jgi:hypothetical protein
MPRLNRKIILTNISEAREELQRIEEMLESSERLEPIHFQIAMQHAFHHLSFAWNIRYWPSKRYTSLAPADFQEAGKFPQDLQFDDD